MTRRRGRAIPPPTPPPACRATCSSTWSPGRPARRGDPRGGAGHGYPGRPAGVRHGQRQGRRGAGQWPGRRHRAAVAGYLHRGDDHRLLRHERGRQLLGQFRGAAREVPVREHRDPPRHVDGRLVPHRAGRIAWRGAAGRDGASGGHPQRGGQPAGTGQQRAADAAGLARTRPRGLAARRAAGLRRQPGPRPHLPLHPRGHRLDDGESHRGDGAGAGTPVRRSWCPGADPART